MRNYAKFCKINVNNKKYQLNLTEAGQEDHLFNKFMSVGIMATPAYLIYKACEYFYLSFLGLALDISFISKVLAVGVIFLTVCLPFTNVGKGYNSILRSLILKHKTKKYYAKMRKLEAGKNNINCKRKDKKQIKLTNKFVKGLKRRTKYNEFMSKKYQRKIEKKGFVDGTNAFANDNIECVQEAIDKFIFHNRDFLYENCPSFRGFIKSRMKTHYEIVKNEGSYYDEYIWSASHDNDMLVKNDCVQAFETTNYFENLKKLFNIKSTTKTATIIPTQMKIEERKLQPVNSQKLCKDIYKTVEEIK